MHIRLDRQYPQYRRADAPRDAFAHQYDPERPRRRGSPRHDRVHTVRDPHVPLQAIPQGHLYLRLGRLRAVSLSLRSGMPHDLDLPDVDTRDLALHRGGASAEESRMVQRHPYPRDDNRRLHILPDTLRAALRHHGGGAADGNVERAGDEHHDQHHVVLCQAHRDRENARPRENELLDLQCGD